MGDRRPDATIFSRVDAIRVLPHRSPGAHKWGVGGLMIVAGAPGYVGAAALCALAAGRSGAGIVNLAVNRSLVPAIAPLVPEAGFTILPDGDFAASSMRLFDTIEAKAARCAAFVIGPGLGEDDYARSLVATLLGVRSRSPSHTLGFGLSAAPPDEPAPKSLLQFDKPIVVDADGLNALSTMTAWWEAIPESRLILTPHVGELSRLLESDSASILADPEQAAIQAARTFRQVVLLKANPSLVASGDSIVRCEDSPLSLATAGTGDVLAGSIGAFLAQGLALADAANLALYVGARAARIAEQEFGTLGMIASDLPRSIAAVLADLERA